MENPTIEAFLMNPDQKTDCRNPKCYPAIGGICAGIPNTDIQWCCKAFDPHCWRGPQLCNFTATNELVGQIRCSLPAWPTNVWCCDKLYERCPPNIEGVQCIPLYYENPALRGPAWSPSTGAKNTGDSPDTVQDTEANSSEESPDTVQDTGWTPRPAAQGPAGPTGPGVNTFVALGVGVLVGMGLVAGVGFWLWARRERRKKVRAERAAVVT